MNTKSVLALLTALSILAFAPTGRAADITANGSGNWSSTNVDAPWPNGIVPGPNDDVDIEAPYTITVDTNVVIQFLSGSGTGTMGANTTLNIVGDAAGGQGTQSLGLLDTSAAGNTVIYSGNPFWAKHQDYYNLVFSNT